MLLDQIKYYSHLISYEQCFDKMYLILVVQNQFQSSLCVFEARSMEVV